MDSRPLQGPTRQTIIFRADKTKTATRRDIPMGAKLAAVLAMRTHAPDGQPFGPDAYVFGNEVGRKIASIKKAWMTTVLRAHGYTPQWVKGTKNHLTPESRAAYRGINLHFHDLRREFGSRALEAGCSLAEVRDLLGHSNVVQTCTYLATTAKSLGLAIDKIDQQEAADHARAEAQRHATAQTPHIPPTTAASLPALDEEADTSQVVKH